MNVRHAISVLLLPFFVLTAATACEDDPTAVDEDDDHTHPSEEVTVELTVTPDHVHIWETEATFTVSATDHDGNAVTDFDTLRVERKAHDSDTWREIELSQEGDVYTGTYVFSSSGEYDIRVVGMRPGDHETGVLHEMADHLHVARAHAEAGGYRIEFETFPGHIHEGDEATLRFWVMESEEDESGTRPPVTGLTPEIHVTEADDTEADHAAAETDAGVYEADHGFGSAGDAVAALHFTGSEGATAEAAIEIHVAEGH